MRETTGGDASTRSRFPAAISAAGLRFLGHPVPAGEFCFPHGLPTGGPAAGPQRGFRVAHEQDATGQGAPFTPGTVVRTRAAIILRPAPAALRRPVPTARWNIPPAGVTFTRRHQGFTHVRPSPITAGYRHRARKRRRFPPVFSSPAAPGWDRGRFGFFPRLRTPRLPAAHARAETGQRALARVTRLRHQPGLQRRLPLELMHPHVAHSRR
jgi:hypothetical protein